MSRVFSDLDLTFQMNPATGDIFKVYDDNAIKRAIKVLIMTNYYERPFHSEIGSPIRNILFENWSPMLVINIKRSIEYLIGTYEPRVKLLEVAVDPYTDGDMLVSIGVLYQIRNTDIQSMVTVKLNRTR